MCGIVGIVVTGGLIDGFFNDLSFDHKFFNMFINVKIVLIEKALPLWNIRGGCFKFVNTIERLLYHFF